jgi:flagellar motor switch/type III secretory pathway protein FliN
MSEAATQTAVAAPEPVPLPPPDEDARWKDVLGLPCTISVEIPIVAFAVKDMLNLEPQVVISSAWATTSNVSLRVNGEAVAWCEFEVLGNQLAVRLTELA